MAFSPPPPSPVTPIFEGYSAPIAQLLPFVFLAVAGLVIARAVRWSRRRRGSAKAPDEGYSPAASDKIGALERAKTGKFSKRRLFNQSELKIFRLLEHEIKSYALPLRVMGQTSLRGFLDTDSPYVKGGSHYAIGDRTVDFVVADGEGNVVLAVEYNGAGHYQNNAEERDAIKSIALGKAGVPFLTIEAADKEHLIRQRIRHKLGVTSE